MKYMDSLFSLLWRIIQKMKLEIDSFNCLLTADLLVFKLAYFTIKNGIGCLGEYRF